MLSAVRGRARTDGRVQATTAKLTTDGI